MPVIAKHTKNENKICKPSDESTLVKMFGFHTLCILLSMNTEQKFK